MLEEASADPGDDLTALHLIEAGGRIALICIWEEGLSERLVPIAQRLDYQVMVAEGPSSALSRLEFDPCPLIVLDETFGGTDSSRNPVLLYLQGLAMPMRRRSFVCLVTKETRTLDPMAAFRLGVDLIFNLQDVEKMEVVLARLIQDHQRFYAMFTDELGKKETSLV
jgi:hypothetical protein